jgi:hypothetical protein
MKDCWRIPDFVNSEQVHNIVGLEQKVVSSFETIRKNESVAIQNDLGRCIGNDLEKWISIDMRKRYPLFQMKIPHFRSSLITCCILCS